MGVPHAVRSSGRARQVPRLRDGSRTHPVQRGHAGRGQDRARADGPYPGRSGEARDLSNRVLPRNSGRSRAVTGRGHRLGLRQDRRFSRAPYRQQDQGWAVRGIDLLQAQQELLIAHSMAGSEEDGMLQAARRRLSQMGASQWLIDQIEEQDRVYSDVTVSSAYTGTVLERLVQDGDWVEKGQPILRIADLRTIWVQAELLEGQQGLLALGDTVMVSPPGSRSGGMPAVVEQIEPYLDPVTRSSARVSLDNAQSSWLPGQLAMVETRVPESEPGSADGAVLSVPASSVLSLGTRSVVYVEDIAASDAASDLPTTTRGLVLRPRLVEVGPIAYDAAGDRYRMVISGLRG
jgi:multidrug efflux pump subunit AcrA (membrane-fusion protein)